MTYDAQAEKLNREADAARALLAEIGRDDDELMHDTVEGETSLFEAIDAALFEIDDCAITITGCKEREAQLADRRNRAVARQDRLRGLIEQAMVMVGIDTVKRPTATLSIAKVNPKPIITDEAEVPSIYWKQPEPVLDKAKINEDAKTRDIPGVSMTNGGTSLKIRRA